MHLRARQPWVMVEPRAIASVADDDRVPIRCRRSLARIYSFLGSQTMRLDPRRRFRDRLLVGMVAVALLPLAGFAILAAFELDSFGHSTAAQAQGAILQDEQDRQQSIADSRGSLIDARVLAISTELSHLAESVKNSLTTSQAASVPDALTAYGGALYSGGISDPESLVLSTSDSGSLMPPL